MVKTIDAATKPKEERNQNSAVMLLSHIGKRTYHTIYNALQTTETMRNNMSEYSTSDLNFLTFLCFKEDFLKLIINLSA